MLSRATKRRILYRTLIPVVVFFLKILRFTCKIKYHGHFIEDNSILLCWHDEILFSPFCVKENDMHGKTVGLMASPHADGQLIAKIASNFIPIKVIKGSSRKNASNALRQSIKTLKTPKHDIAIAPDGPKGPRHSVAQGAVVLSQKLHIPIVTVGIKPHSFWKFSTWDKMKLPKPFSKIDIFIGEAFFLDGLSLQEAKDKIKSRMGDE